MTRNKLVAILLALLMCCNAAKAQDVDTVFAALKALYKSTDGGNWNQNYGWDTTAVPVQMSDLSNWHGLLVIDGNLRGLDLFNNNLAGSIPPEIGDLTSLYWLDFGFNKLHGDISNLGDLSSLQKLTLNHNQFDSSIPAEIGSLTDLRMLNLDLNQFTGPVPPELGNLTQLHTLWLHENKLTGTLPRTFLQLNSQNNMSFAFHNNDGLCAPADVEFQNWLNKTSGLLDGWAGPTCVSVSNEDEPQLPEGIHFYPNPVTDYVSFTGLPYGAQIEVFDVLGRKVISTEESRLNLNILAPGLYLYAVRSSAGITTSGNLIKQ